jgi:4-hydroxybenzoate polyprenyltransferase
MFLYILSISILSRKEIEGTQVKRAIVYPFLIVFAIIICIMLASYLGIFQIDLFVSLILFVSIMIITFKQSITFYSSSDVIQNAVRNMIISIIILDSVFISGTAGLYYGLPIILFIVPSIVLSRKLYMT